MSMYQPMDLTDKVNASTELANLDLRSDHTEELSASSPVLATPVAAFAAGAAAGYAVAQAID
jgi:hypothetical protein